MRKHAMVYKMTFFRRGTPEVQVVEALSDQSEHVETFSAEPLSAYEFIDANQKTLADSTVAWNNIATELTTLQEPPYTEALRSGIDEVWKTWGYEGHEDDLQKATDKLSFELSICSLLIARQFSSQGIELSNVVNLGKQHKKHWLELPDQNVSFIIGRKEFPTRRFLLKQTFLADHMERADWDAQKVLTNLVDTYFDHPKQLEDLADLYSNDAAKIDPDFKELQQMISVDWHHPDEGKSVLKRYCSQLREEPDRYLDSFGLHVAAEKDNQQLLKLQNMARFAIIATQGNNPITDEVIRDVIVSTHNRWDEVDSIDKLFSNFVDMNVGNVEQALSAIAGPRIAKNIRMHPTKLEVDRLKNGFSISDAADRSSRRKEAKKFGKASGGRQLPSAADIDSAATKSAEQNELPERSTSITRIRQGGDAELIQIKPDKIAEKFKMDNSKTLVNDIEKMILWMQKNPISIASRPLRRKNTISINSKTHKLWRFAPDDAPNLEIHGDNRYTRIVYAVTDESIAVTDVLPHDAFDKKY